MTSSTQTTSTHSDRTYPQHQKMKNKEEHSRHSFAAADDDTVQYLQQPPVHDHDAICFTQSRSDRRSYSAVMHPSLKTFKTI